MSTAFYSPSSAAEISAKGSQAEISEAELLLAFSNGSGLHEVLAMDVQTMPMHVSADNARTVRLLLGLHRGLRVEESPSPKQSFGTVGAPIQNKPEVHTGWTSSSVEQATRNVRALPVTAAGISTAARNSSAPPTKRRGETLTDDARRAVLEADNCIGQITQRAVACRGCKELDRDCMKVLENRGNYYPGNWWKHKKTCKGLRVLLQKKIITTQDIQYGI